MIGSVRGRLLHAGDEQVVVEAGGVGYQLSVPTSTRAALPPVGQEVFLWVHTFVREQVISLYGFADREELELFVELLGVSGIGPRLALTVLSTFSPREFRRVIAAGDGTALTRIPGVGKKTAQRLLFELKGKVAPPPPDGAGGAGPGEPGGPWADALAALVSLGYSADEAAAALEAAAPAAKADGREPDASELLRLALRRLGSEQGR